MLCFGEALWDVFPTYSRPGGAPLNVAVQLRRLGRRSVPLSSVGRDAAGDRLLARISIERVPIRGIGRHPTLPTGRVDVTPDADGDVAYEIRAPAAWDRIAITASVADDVRSAAAMVFGTLAQRSAENRATLDELLGAIPRDALAVLDVNIRMPHYDHERALELAARADLVKVNRDELARLGGDGQTESVARSLAERLAIPTLCVTMGRDGSALLRDGAWVTSEAGETHVVDPVGAGDAFLAGLLDALLADKKPDAALEAAASVASGVVSRSGAW